MRIPDFIRNNKLVTTLVLILLVPVIVFSLWAYTALHYTYSAGHRAGYLQKISKRGWLCKTWEGEIQLTAQPGTAPETFTFSVRSDSIAGELEKLTGQRIAVTYSQHKGVPTSCFGDTEYFITGVKPVGST